MEKIESELKALGVYQIIGGAIGIFVSLLAIIKSTSVLATYVVLSANLVFAFSIVCGVWCVMEKPEAISLSLINQYLQTIGFSIMGLGLSYFSGVYLSIGLDLTDSFDLKLNMGLSQLYLKVDSNSQDLIVNVNIFAIVLIYWIDKLKVKAGLDKKSYLASSKVG